MQLKIATGRSRKEKKWKNIEISWSDLCKKLSETYRTRETMAEYAKLKKPNQDEIKDVGGFVGGWLAQGQRKSDTVLCRTVLTLDVDNALPSFWDDLTLLNDYACCIYSTHKHKPEAWRVRLIIPMAREVSAEEYEAIARWVAKELGIDQFDDTTYQASRLMYWPSTSKDGEFVYKYQDGPFLDPDAVLANYPDWHDVSFWPQSSRVSEIVHKQAKRQGDPLTKEGLIGAFCRTYSIEAAIETFLSDVYLPCNVPGRYTYAGGSTAAGLVLYDDKFAYSNHGTDPASGKLCNAFDLVRIHKFGELDDDAKVDTPANKLPSYLAMMDMAAADPETRKTSTREQLEAAQVDFSGIDGEGDDWMEKLEKDRKNNTIPSLPNLVLILENDPHFKGNLAYNELKYQPEVNRDLPWRSVSDKTLGWTDSDDSNLLYYLEKGYRCKFPEKTLNHGITVVSTAHSFHPIKAYLESCAWDKVPRIDTLLIDFFDADDNAYVRAVTRKTLVAAVARIMNPGCKFDYMLTLTGTPGIGKSTMFKLLADPWFSDSLLSVTGKESYEQLQGVWIMEMGELSTLKRAEVNSVKNYLSKQEDKYRMAYGHRNTDCPRQCIFVGTTNEPQFLRDETGNRRFWVVDVRRKKQKVWEILTPEMIKKLWAEAKYYYEAGEKLFLNDELEQTALLIQEDHMEDDPRRGMIQGYLDTLLPENWDEMDKFQRRQYINGDEFASPQGDKGILRREKICAAEVIFELFGNDPGKAARFEVREINSILAKIPGWERILTPLRFSAYGMQRGFRRKK